MEGAYCAKSCATATSGVRGGDDVPAGPACAEVIQRREPAGSSIGCAGTGLSLRSSAALNSRGAPAAGPDSPDGDTRRGSFAQIGPKGTLAEETGHYDLIAASKVYIEAPRQVTPMSHKTQ